MMRAVPEQCPGIQPISELQGQRRALWGLEDSTDETLQYWDEVAAYVDYKTPKDDSLGALS